MTVRGRLLFCSTLRDSFSILWIGESRQSVKAALSDPKPRFSTTHFLAEDGESIVADKEGQLVGLIADGILALLLVLTGDLNVPRNRSAREVFVANLGSPVLRFRSGVMQGPRFADKVMPVEVPLIAVSIDGSVTIIEELHPTLAASLRWLEKKLTFPGSPLLVPGTPRPLFYSSLCVVY